MQGGRPVDCLYFSTYAAFAESARELRAAGAAVYESDVYPAERFLMERFVKGGFEAAGRWQEQDGMIVCRNPRIRGAAAEARISVMSLDIETDVAAGEVLSIACSGKRDRVFMRGNAQPGGQTLFCKNEQELLQEFFGHVRSEDPDVIIGWNVVDFDLQVLQDRCDALGLTLRLGRDGGGRIVESKNTGQRLARIPGRAVMDVPEQLRAHFRTFEEYSLDFVANVMLGKGKTIRATGRAKTDEIVRLWRSDPAALAAYNLNDARLAREIFERAGILPNAIERSKRSGLLLDRTGGSVAAFDYLYLPLLHRASFVAPDAADIAAPSAPLPGGHVLEPTPGLYDNVLVFDFRSLYPSIIMTFKIDPLGRMVHSGRAIAGPAGPAFSDEVSILPLIIAELMEARGRAKQENNPYLSQAIKILMNSFYGVLGTTGCRFFSSELATAITQTGQFILKQTIEHIQKSTPYPVIYGDTDSLFVHLGKGTEERAADEGRAVAREVTQWLAVMVKERFNATSALELQYERHFRRFFVPSLRGSSQGSKKHYCGTVEDASGVTLLFKGMESARSDWTDLAKEFQHELFTRFFQEKPLEAYILETVEKVRKGAADDKLVYKKRLRKRLDEYTDNAPHHVQAARLLESPGHLIRYYITSDGPQPVEKRSSPIDYEHYVESQLKPIADSILEWQGTSFDKIVSGQQDLFE